MIQELESEIEPIPPGPHQEVGKLQQPGYHPSHSAYQSNQRFYFELHPSKLVDPVALRVKHWVHIRYFHHYQAKQHSRFFLLRIDDKSLKPKIHLQSPEQDTNYFIAQVITNWYTNIHRIDFCTIVILYSTYNNGAGAISVSAVEYDDSTKVYAMNIGVPIRDNLGNKVIGVLRGTVNVSSVFSDLSSIKVGKTGNAVLLDSDGNILYAPNASLLMQPGPQAWMDVIQNKIFGWTDKLNDLDGNPAVVTFQPLDGDLAESLGWILHS